MSLPSVLVVHGALGSAEQMQPMVDALVATSRFATVRAVELPGHGRTPLAEGQAFNMDVFADAIADATDAAMDAAAPPIVFGYSMGGYAALLLAARAPGLLGGIVTLGTMLRWTPEVAAHAASRLDPTVVAAKVPAFAATLAARHEQAGGWETVMHRTAALLRGLGDAPPLTEATFAAIDCPVHLLVGEKDDSVTIADCESAVLAMRHATATMLPGMPHPIERVPGDTVAGFVLRVRGETAG